MYPTLLRCSLLLTLTAASAAPHAAEVQVAVAANFAGPLGRIGEGFTASTGHVLKVSAGSTGKFYTQILSGAPFEVLIAADDETPKKLVTEGHAISGSNVTYAIGQLVLWSSQPGMVDDAGAVLGGDAYTRLAIANPKVAPYGKAALEVLQVLGLSARATPRLVIGDTITQAYQFVATGNAEIGFVALSQVAVPGKPSVGSMWRVPQSMYGEIRQDAVLLKAGERNAAARALLDYLKGADARAVIQAWGYR